MAEGTRPYRSAEHVRLLEMTFTSGSHLFVCFLGEGGRLEVFINERIQELLSQGRGDLSIRGQLKLWPFHH